MSKNKNKYSAPPAEAGSDQTLKTSQYNWGVKICCEKNSTLSLLLLLLLIFQQKFPVLHRLTNVFKFLSWSWLPSWKKDSHLRFTCLKFHVLIQFSTYIGKEKNPLKPPRLHTNPNENWDDFCDWAGLWAPINIPALLLQEKHFHLYINDHNLALFQCVPQIGFSGIFRDPLFNQSFSSSTGMLLHKTFQF